MEDQWFHKIFSVAREDFETTAIEIFQFQYRNNPLYKSYADLLGIDPARVKSIAEIPFLPIQFYKTHAVKATQFAPAIIFESSGTTRTGNSRHFVKDMGLYRQSFLKGFEMFYGPVGAWRIIGLLPSYLERKNSSLVFMVSELMAMGQPSGSGFYLHDHEELRATLQRTEAAAEKVLLIGVSFALLDFAEGHAFKLEHTTIMETGGMKGRRREMIRGELHERLIQKFQVPAIHSEYGMTELLSQAYSRENGIFHCSPWMRVLIRDEEDPLSTSEFGFSEREKAGTKRGAINIIDLANVYSCSFIATDDAGKLHADGSFEVLGRLDNSDTRGCSLMAL